MRLTQDQVTALAPDAASYKAGKGLASLSKWSALGGNEEALWGLAKGSGSKPYQTQIALGAMAFKCSCPSRKFPCKHALGLMFLTAENPAVLQESTPPLWVSEWLEDRAKREEKSASKKSEAKPKDEEAAKVRRAQRETNINQGVTSLCQYLEDLVRRGIASPQTSDSSAWEALAKRLIDAQAPGLAGQIRTLSDIPDSKPNWEQSMLHELGLLHLQLLSFIQRDTLTAELRHEVEQRAGLPIDKEEVLSTPGIEDCWFVASRRHTERDRLITSRTWLYGRETKQWALSLQFGPPQAPPKDRWPVGSSVETSLHFYPGAIRERALPANENASSRELEAPKTSESITEMLERAANAMAESPWTNRIPTLLKAYPTQVGGQRFLRDADGNALPLNVSNEVFERMVCSCGGRPSTIMAEWDHSMLNPMSMADENQWSSLTLQMI